MEALLFLLGGIVLLALAFVWSVFSWGYVCWKFWYWFVLPVFPALPHITWLQAAGLIFFISLFKVSPSQLMKEDYVVKNGAGWMNAGLPIVTFIVGWLAYVLFF